MEERMWSYRMVWDYLFAPNPLFDILTLATCKPSIRRSPNTKEGVWIAGFTACTVHDSPLFGGGISQYGRGKEKLIYLAQVGKVLSLDEYWKEYPQKRCVMGVDKKFAQWYGDNIYSASHTDEEGNVIAWKNNGGHEGVNAAKSDFYYGKNALICNRFYYLTPQNRMEIPTQYKNLVHGGIGQSLKTEKVSEFIEHVENYATERGVSNGIVGEMPIIYLESSASYQDEDAVQEISPNTGNKRKIKGCSK